MALGLSRTVALAVYQLTVLLGILLFPVAMLAERLGIPFPLERLLGWLRGLADARPSG